MYNHCRFSYHFASAKQSTRSSRNWSDFQLHVWYTGVIYRVRYLYKPRKVPQAAFRLLYLWISQILPIYLLFAHWVVSQDWAYSYPWYEGHLYGMHLPLRIVLCILFKHWLTTRMWLARCGMMNGANIEHWRYIAVSLCGNITLGSLPFPRFFW